MGKSNISCSEDLSSKWEGRLFMAVDTVFSQHNLTAHVRILERGAGPGHLEHVISAGSPRALLKGAPQPRTPDAFLPLMEIVFSFCPPGEPAHSYTLTVTAK